MGQRAGSGNSRDSRKYVYLFLIVILLLGVSLRIWAINSESYWVDEVISIRQAQANYTASIEMMKSDVHPPLYIFLLHIWGNFFGLSESSSRSLSMIFGVLSIWVMYLLARKLFSERIALLAAVLMAVSPVMIYFSQEARMYSLLVLLVLLSYYFLIRYVEKIDDGKPYLKDLIYYCIFTLLLIYTHIFAFLVLLAQNIFMIYRYAFHIGRSRKQFFRRLLPWFSSQFALLLLFIPWVPILLMQLQKTLGSGWWIPKPTFIEVIWTFMYFFGNWVNLAFFIVLIFIFIFHASKKRSKASGFGMFGSRTSGKNSGDFRNHVVLLLWSWIIVPFFIVITYSLIFHSLYTPRYMLFTFPAMILLFSMMIDKVTGKKAIRSVLISLVILSCLISVVVQAEHLDKDDWRGVAKFIKENAKEGEVIMIDPPYHQDAFTYYYDAGCFKDPPVFYCNLDNHNIISVDWGVTYYNDTTPLVAAHGSKTLGSYMENNVWLISVRPDFYPSVDPLFEYLDAKKGQVQKKKFGKDITVYEFE